MKHTQQMSLIARRAQIRRAAAHRKDSSSTQPIGRPALRLVISGGEDVDRDQQADHREPASHVE
ncbi:hypothetical protein [uncultured Bosea sp.]|uniref:hypothetical protein n=1 Tax=uncultured Bosea sp. TaxID=211457 RepID=UPI00263B835D|nr:hypothetical protein [uncultured Bosea sp.]